MTTSVLTPKELRRLTLKEIFRANVGIGEFESLGKSFPDIALHYIYVSFDSFAHFESCPCPCPFMSDCELCFFREEDPDEVFYDYILSAYTNASLADLLVQRFLALEYEKKTREMIALSSASSKELESYLKTNATDEERDAVSSYRSWCDKHDAARDELSSFLRAKECSTLARDLLAMIEDVDTDEVEECVDLFRNYSSTAREMYYAYQEIIPVRQKLESERLNRHRTITCIEWTLTAVGVLAIIGKVVGFFA